LLRPRLRAVAHLDPVVDATDDAGTDDGEDDEDPAPREDRLTTDVGEQVPERGADDDGDAAHGRRARLGDVALGPVLPDGLADAWARSQLMRNGVPTIEVRKATVPAMRRAITPDHPGRRRSASDQTELDEQIGHHGTVVEGHLAVAMTCVASWPLPATTTTSPGRMPAGRSAMAVRRSAWRATGAPPGDGLGSRRHGLDDGRSGSSLRGLSEVDDHRVGQAGGDAPITGRLERSGRRRTRNDGDPAGGERAGRPQHLLEPVGGVGVVDDHADGGAGHHHLEAAGHGPAASSPRAMVAGARRGEAAAVAAARPWATLKAPGSGMRSRSPPPRARRPRQVGDEVGGVGQREPLRRDHGGVEQEPAVRVVGVDHRPRRTAPARRGAALAAKYASIVPWWSRWSGVRFVNTATAKRVPATRPWDRAWDGHLHGDGPASRRRAWPASRPGSSGPSGVLGGPPGRALQVADGGVGRPSASRMAASRWVVVVLPFVPVTPDHGEVAGTGGPCRAAARPHGPPHVADAHLGHGHVHVALAQEGDGTGGHGRRREVVAVDGRARHAAEQRPGDDGPGVVDDGGDLGRRRITLHRQRVEAVHEVGEAHRRPG
jgi:hypothetical protein